MPIDRRAARPRTMHPRMRIMRFSGKALTERLLYRLFISKYAGDFVLKGAMLFTAWTGPSYRPTVDMESLGHGEDSRERLAEVFWNICGFALVTPRY
ncbi:MAG: nucleotidyl transferase AbiEii/AbiGii toxin family protein [Desulfatiglandaceae bacterium]